MVYIPGALKVFTGLFAVDDVPSPKFQLLLCPVGEEVLLNVAGDCAHTLSGAVKEVLIF